MNSSVYINKLKKKYQRYFDIEEDLIVGEVPVNLFAKSHIRNEKYFASKSVTLYAFENNEYCYAKSFENSCLRHIEGFTEMLKMEIENKVNVHEDHMSSTFTGIVITKGSIPKEVIRYVKRFAYQKSYWFGFKGWSDLRLILIDLETGNVYASRKAKEVQKLYKPA